MEYVKSQNAIIVRLDIGEDINESLLKVAEKEKIKFASVSGIGATDDFTVGIFDLDNSQYDSISYHGNHEITSLCGNINTKDDKPYVHLHINCADKTGNIVGGHLLKSRISLTCEIVIAVSDIRVDRKYDEVYKINRLSF